VRAPGMRRTRVLWTGFVFLGVCVLAVVLAVVLAGVDWAGTRAAERHQRRLLTDPAYRAWFLGEVQREQQR
jgi:hypothetical protein